MATGDLTSLEKVKRFLSLAGSDDDGLLGDLITQMTEFINTYISRDLLSASYTEKYSGVGGSKLSMKNYPITAVASVSVGGVALQASDGNSTGFAFDEFSVVYIGGVFPKGYNNVAIAYTAGYPAVPAEIELACIELVVLAYRERPRLGKRSESQPQGGTTSYTVDALTPRAKAMLNNYSRKIPV